MSRTFEIIRFECFKENRLVYAGVLTPWTDDIPQRLANLSSSDNVTRMIIRRFQCTEGPVETVPITENIPNAPPGWTGKYTRLEDE